jgi:hypothetical protein
MLVSQVGQIVDTIDLVPDVSLWKVSNWSKWGNDMLNLIFVARVSSAWSAWVNKSLGDDAGV